MFKVAGILITKEMLIIAALFIVLILFLIYIASINRRIKAMDKKLKAFCKGKKIKDMETMIMSHFDDVESLDKKISNQQIQINNIRKYVNRSYQKTSILRYDAYEEMGGKLSFVLCLLDEKNDGILLNTVYSRDGSYSYIKEVIDGESPLTLTAEEDEVLMRTAEKE